MKLKLCGGFIRCSPLYVILCILSIVSENTGLFLNYIAALMLHECAHCIMAGMLGCRVSSLELLPYASLIITSEDGIRFLMDHINGDTYYNIYYPGQNLDRARTQLKLLEDMEKKLPEIVRILEEIYADLKLNVQLDCSKTLKQWKEKMTCE